MVLNYRMSGVELSIELFEAEQKPKPSEFKFNMVRAQVDM